MEGTSARRMRRTDAAHFAPRRRRRRAGGRCDRQHDALGGQRHRWGQRRRPIVGRRRRRVRVRPAIGGGNVVVVVEADAVRRRWAAVEILNEMRGGGGGKLQFARSRSHLSRSTYVVVGWKRVGGWGQWCSILVDMLQKYCTYVFWCWVGGCAGWVERGSGCLEVVFCASVQLLEQNMRL